MNSKQGARYIKRRMEQQVEKKPSILNCPRCSLINAIDNKYCSKCSYPLVPSAFDEIKEDENRRLKTLAEKYEQDMNAMRQEMERKFQQILTKIDIATLNNQ